MKVLNETIGLLFEASRLLSISTTLLTGRMQLRNQVTILCVSFGHLRLLQCNNGPKPSKFAFGEGHVACYINTRLLSHLSFILSSFLKSFLCGRLSTSASLAS